MRVNTNKLNRSLVQIDRYCGYLLFVLMGLYFISGYGRSKHILDPFFTKMLHEKWLPVPTLVAFVVHSLLNVRFILIRKGVENKLWWNVYLIVFGFVVLGFFVYIHFS